MDQFIVAQQTTNSGTVQSAPPTAVPDPHLDQDGGLMLQVAAYWALALIVIFSVFYFVPKLKRNIANRRDQRLA